ncbi:D-ribose pyranase [Photorhabdus laumondii subsp. laumondii]|uniref:D-ribose pyranase n=3 Tax=Photorhabdus laumondii TaxID=2218628 RepID=RBSD_PHOLL|nr:MULTISPECIES: D-ribose pyranase [Photorhabdus]Q7NA80.1 RecName: Full=D-ribose pyranase [Photorhabdus laumondii subsp. laumondii TTO1]AWK40070.1 D-ribose pyranase [Photorhabdus laumondii subsp. laumondii]AXG40896.1 D-ribose pyranase [Photorhabdus laumondii subsp. laumondii]AXG45418.1 D-ribose pyranase [Photorhabdus laumondii subsp. laumondii]KTL60345.1 D-ribose pyranase [Photorhabdus laumondii subsp. laumondii]MCC8384465.1 D-ribose pyranase [Photorhabdus laumondii]
MKKGVLLNSEISAVISQLGHTDQITIGDAGLPIPSLAQRIDLALTQGIPSFISVLNVVTQEMQIEAAFLAEEIIGHNPLIHQLILTQIKELEKQQGNSITVDYISHNVLKEKTKHSRAVIRTGEHSPYANIILGAGVTF